MELYKYDFTYMFTIPHWRTTYQITDKPVDNKIIVEYGTDISISKGTEIINPLSCIVEKQQNTDIIQIHVPDPQLNTTNNLFAKEEIQLVQKQMRMILQACHIANLSEFVINIGGSVCNEQMAKIIQSTLQEKNGVFTNITICCPNNTVRKIYEEIFRPAGNLRE